MSYVVTSACFNCKYTDCVAVCPVDAFHEGEKMLYIMPSDLDGGCIDCDACVSVCPVEAIFSEDDVPEEEKEFIALNREMAQKTPLITEQKKPLCDE